MKQTTNADESSRQAQNQHTLRGISTIQAIDEPLERMLGNDLFPADLRQSLATACRNWAEINHHLQHQCQGQTDGGHQNENKEFLQCQGAQGDQRTDKNLSSGQDHGVVQSKGQSVGPSPGQTSSDFADEQHAQLMSRFFSCRDELSKCVSDILTYVDSSYGNNDLAHNSASGKTSGGVGFLHTKF